MEIKVQEYNLAIAGKGESASVEMDGIAIAGTHGEAKTGYCGTAIAGCYGTAITGNYGYAQAGYEGSAAAGENGIIQILWHDGKRHRLAVRYVGENGIKPNVEYHLDAEGQFVEVTEDYVVSQKTS